MKAELKGNLWVISVDPNELHITATRSWPYASTIGTINQRGTLSVWRPATGAPRNWGQLARYKLEEARSELYRKGELVDRKAVKSRKEEEKTGSFIVRLSNGKSSRFHEMKRGVVWAEEHLKGKTTGTVAEFYRSHPSAEYVKGHGVIPWTKPFHVLVVDSYGRIVMEGAPSAPRRDPAYGGTSRRGRDAGKAWQDKARRIIGELSKESYAQAQKTRAGSKRKRHVPYSVPETAQRLIEALNRNDEETAKSIMMYDYEAQRVAKRDPRRTSVKKRVR